MKLGNAQWRAKSGKDLIGPTESLLLSPVVIAMWQPMAEALGWGKNPVGWQEILTLAKDPRGWEAHGYPQWGRFKFGHTHPQYSNSGLISLFAEVYAASGKMTGLTPADVAKPETAVFLSDIERSVVHYGSSTGFFGKKMFANGPSYMSAAVLYENMVIEAAISEKALPFPIVAIYPREGTFWSDHPAGIVEREWVTPEHREAAKVYFGFLLALATSPRFQRFNDAESLQETQSAAESRRHAITGKLAPEALLRMAKLDEKCARILQLCVDSQADDFMIDSDREALKKLSGLYLKLLLAAQNLTDHDQEAVEIKSPATCCGSKCRSTSPSKIPASVARANPSTSDSLASC